MMVVDTSVWAAFFNGDASPEVRTLEEVLGDEGDDVVLLPLVLTEVLMGFRTDAGYRRAARLLGRLPMIEPGPEAYVRAAALYRGLRRKGVTARGAVDCLIAQSCIDTGARLLTLDRDFTQIARHAPLSLVTAE